MAKVKDGRKAPFFWAERRIITVYGKRMKSSGIAVYCCLAAHANQQRESYPSLQMIADETDLSRRYVITVIDRLVRLGLVEIRERKIREGEARRSNVYVLCDPPDTPLFDATEDKPPRPRRRLKPKEQRDPEVSYSSPASDPHDTSEVRHSSPASEYSSPAGDLHDTPPLCIEQESRNKNQGTPAGQAAHPPDFDSTARGCATAYVWYAKGIPDRERNLDYLTDVFEDMAEHGVPYRDIQAHIRDPARPKSQYFWEFRSKWKEVFRVQTNASVGASASGHMGFHSRISTPAATLAAIQAKTLRAGEVASQPDADDSRGSSIGGTLSSHDRAQDARGDPLLRER